MIPRCQSSDITVLETNVWLDDEDGTARGELVLGSTRAEDCRLTGTLTAMLQATGLPTIHFPEQEVDTVLIGRGSLTITIRYQVSGRCVDPTATLRLAIGQHGPWQLAGYPAECPSEAPR